MLVIEEQTISADPTNPTVVNVYYKYKTYTINFNYDSTTDVPKETVTEGGVEQERNIQAPAAITAKYGERVNLSLVAEVSGYTFKGWIVYDRATYEDKKAKGLYDTQLFVDAWDSAKYGDSASKERSGWGVWAKANATYKVHHMREELDGVTYTEVYTDTISAVTGDTTNATPKAVGEASQYFNGFYCAGDDQSRTKETADRLQNDPQPGDPDFIVQKSVGGNNSTEIYIYYKGLNLKFISLMEMRKIQIELCLEQASHQR